MSHRVLTAALFCLLLAPAAATAAKTDVLVMANGDHVTCDIKSLQYGMLTVKTDDMGTLQVKWDKVRRLTSVHSYLVRTRSGFLHYGRLTESGDDRVLRVASMTRDVDLAMGDVASIEAIKQDLWDKFDLAISLGYQYTKATSTTALKSQASMDYRGRIHRAGGKVLADVNETETDLKKRYDLDGYYSRVISGKLRALASGGARRHDELGLQLRLRGGGGLGYAFIDGRTTALSAISGIYLTREWALDGGIGEDSWEATLGGSFKIFAFESPKTDVTFDVMFMPNLTINDRLRSDIDLKARREMIKDLFLVVSWYESRDNKPPQGAEAQVDRGLGVSVEWSK